MFEKLISGDPPAPETGRGRPAQTGRDHGRWVATEGQTRARPQPQGRVRRQAQTQAHTHTNAWGASRHRPTTTNTTPQNTKHDWKRHKGAQNHFQLQDMFPHIPQPRPEVLARSLLDTLFGPLAWTPCSGPWPGHQWRARCASFAPDSVSRILTQLVMPPLFLRDPGGAGWCKTPRPKHVHSIREVTWCILTAWQRHQK